MMSAVNPNIAIEKIKRWCAFQERAQQEVRDKLFKSGLYSSDVERIIAQLVEENFINEERYAIAYASGKFRQLGWGKEKIKAMLIHKKISNYCINKALNGIDKTEYINRMIVLMEKKKSTIKSTNAYEEKAKLAGFLIGKGYESDLVWNCINS